MERRETILLVEDEDFVCRAAAEILAFAGYKLLVAKNSSQALQACRPSSEEIDLLLADVVMPGMNGYQLATAFATLFPRARILLMSGYPQLLYSEHGALGDCPIISGRYLTKPFSASALLSGVSEAIAANSNETLEVA